MPVQTEYDRLLSEILGANQSYHMRYASSPTISELSRITGATEEHILESMEFGQRKKTKMIC